MPEDRTTYTLKHPITYGSQTIATLEIRKPRCGDLRGLPIEGRTVGHTLDVIAKLSGQSPAVVDEMDPEDLMEVTKLFNLF